jgi:hypothetical protein
MRGETRACLIEADDGCAYVVKLANNPQRRRALVNEWIASALLKHLGIATPERAFVDIDEGSLSDPLPAGRHFGSRYPGTPDAVSVWDIWPRALLPKLSNRAHFIGALVFDRWVSNAGPRQAIFFRQFAGAGVPAPPEGCWVAQMIDNGSVFGAGDWTFRDLPAQDLYCSGAAHGHDISARSLAPWLDALADLPYRVLEEAAAELPSEWIRGDERALEGLLAELYARRIRVPAMIARTVIGMGSGTGTADFAGQLPRGVVADDRRRAAW